MLSETRACRTPAGAPDGPAAWREGGAAAGLTLAQAERLLDRLEALGCTGLGACLLEDGGVTVYWDRPAAARAFDRRAGVAYG